jgi:uncharacterized protein (TIGR00290 family)
MPESGQVAAGGRTPVVLSWSGGKDSALALHALRADPRYAVTGLLTTLAEAYGRVSHHGVRAELMERQAAAVGLPLHPIWLPPSHEGDGVAMADYEARMAQAMAECRAAGIQHVAFGDIYLADLRAYRERKLAGVGMTGVFPLWGRDPAALLAEFFALGFQARVVCVDGRRLDRRFVGRALDAAWAAELPPGVDPCGEQGEYHSFVTAGPVFARAVPVTVGAVVQRDVRWFADLLPVEPAPAAPAASATAPRNAGALAREPAGEPA